MQGAHYQIQIRDAGTPLTLDYADALRAHEGESWFGVAIGFRMLQAAAAALSVHALWDRAELQVVSGHPGNGVRHAIEFVTRCVSRGQYRLDNQPGTSGCSRRMRFSWEVTNGRTRVNLNLVEGFVPEELFALLDRRGTRDERGEDAARFTGLKIQLAERVWNRNLEHLFRVYLHNAQVARSA